MSSDSKLPNEENIKAVKLLRLICSTCMGSNGNLKLIQNVSGGHVTVTSSSTRILKNLKVSNPVVRVITSAATTHLNQFSDGGCYFMFLISDLVVKLWELTDEISQSAISRIFEEISRILVEHLKESCNFKVKIEFESLKTLMHIVRSVLSSKPGCQLSKQQESHIVNLILRVFFEGMPAVDCSDTDLGTVHYISVCGVSPQNSQLFPGLLFYQKDLEWTIYDRNLIDEYSGRKNFCCALFRVSLSGDADVQGLSEAEWTINGGVNAAIDACTAQILKLCQQIVSAEVKIVACQKVIHPAVNRYLKQHGVITLDRLGQINFNALVDLSGSVPIESYISPLDPSCLGQIEFVSSIALHDKLYCHFGRHSSRVHTLMLCNYYEESLEELNIVCRQSMATLRGLLSSPFVLHGGGCLEFHLASFVKGLFYNDLAQNIFKTNSKSHVFNVLEAFGSCYEQLALNIQRSTKFNAKSTVEKQHLWLVEDSEEQSKNCVCGKSELSDSDEVHFGTSSVTSQAWIEPLVSSSFENADRILFDSFNIKLNAMKSALEVVDMLLKVDNIIK
ncbi:hypothetical protein CHUAL_006478 [Chamberlinius hualienensis]